MWLAGSVFCNHLILWWSSSFTLVLLCLREPNGHSLRDQVPLLCATFTLKGTFKGWKAACWFSVSKHCGAEPLFLFVVCFCSIWWENMSSHWLQRVKSGLSVVYQQRRSSAVMFVWTEEHTVTPLQVLFRGLLGKPSPLVPPVRPHCYSAGYHAAGESDCPSPSESSRKQVENIHIAPWVLFHTWPSALCVLTRFTSTFFSH